MSANSLELLTTALSFMEDNLTEKITTEDVAKVCYCSKSTLEKLFRCVSHTSVHDYIIRRRMNKAAKMLFSHREISILDVAVLYGYNSNEAFTRAFKQVWNCTPSEFRNNTRYSELFPRYAFDLDKGEQIMNNVMIIDDDLYINKMLEEALVQAGYSVTKAFSGKEALEIVSKVRPDLVLLDLMLPGLSGEELLPHLRGIPVIVVSAKIDVKNKVELLLGGAADYVTKPFDMDELMARITVQLRKTQTSDSGNDDLVCVEEV